LNQPSNPYDKPSVAWSSLWGLDSGVAYLNHGSFGACPRAVLEYQAGLRERLERNPARFLARELEGLLDAARQDLARFVGADPNGMAFVTNATTGVNTVLHSLDLRSGDELLTTNHAYPACRNVLESVAARAGVRVATAHVPFPLRHEGEVCEAVLAAAGPRTRLALLDHVTSPTGLIFPIELLVRELQARGVETLVDGAHAPGMVPVDIGRIGAAYYTGNAHKWLCAPKGAAFLHIREDLRAGVHPLVVSHGYATPLAGRPRFRREFDWTGTCDPTAWISVSEAVRFLGSLLRGGWPELMARNRALALRARTMLLGVLGIEEPCPESMIGAMASVLLPAFAPGSPGESLEGDALTRLLFARRRIETWFSRWHCAGGRVIRISAQLYNTEEEYVRLVAAVRDLLRGEI